MKLQRQPNSWSCLPTSLAIVLDIPVAEIFEEIGHDGSEKVWPNLPEPFCRRCFHLQEIVEVAYNNGFLSVLVEPIPQSCPPMDVQPYTLLGFEELVLAKMAKHKGILMGTVKTNNQGHAIAWDGKRCYDPGGFGIERYDDRFSINSFLIIEKSL